MAEFYPNLMKTLKSIWPRRSINSKYKKYFLKNYFSEMFYSF